MEPFVGTVVAAGGVFTGTNIDDLLVLTVLFLAAGTRGQPRRWQIVVGQYAGIGALVAVSAAAALGLALVPEEWVGLLGVVPLGLGIRGLVAAARAHGQEEPPAPVTASGPLSIAAVTVANGADNIAVYTPVFRTLGVTDAAVTVAVFAVLVAVWCGAAAWLGGHRRVIATVGRAGHWLVPVVFVAIGTVILAESGVPGHLLDLVR